jgi:hypothetical protein
MAPLLELCMWGERWTCANRQAESREGGVGVHLATRRLKQCGRGLRRMKGPCRRRRRDGGHAVAVSRVVERLQHEEAKCVFVSGFWGVLAGERKERNLGQSMHACIYSMGDHLSQSQILFCSQWKTWAGLRLVRELRWVWVRKVWSGYKICYSIASYGLIVLYIYIYIYIYIKWKNSYNNKQRLRGPREPWIGGD